MNFASQSKPVFDPFPKVARLHLDLGDVIVTRNIDDKGYVAIPSLGTNRPTEDQNALFIADSNVRRLDLWAVVVEALDDVAEHHFVFRFGADIRHCWPSQQACGDDSEYSSFQESPPAFCGNYQALPIPCPSVHHRDCNTGGARVFPRFVGTGARGLLRDFPNMDF